eukprot:m.315827 g.315827  ORF g.315827 m.315827 type:complete len:269 (-) comp15976_c0_seq1:4482-5288(-)
MYMTHTLEFYSLILFLIGLSNDATIALSDASLEPGYTMPAQTTVTFSPDSAFQLIEIPLVADDTPQPQRQFMVSLSRGSPEGDYVIPVDTVNTTVTIKANDNAAGVFAIARASSSTLQEGEVANFTVLRTKGMFGTVTVAWETDCDDVSPQTGTISFAPRQSNASLFLLAADDTVPELDKQCTVALKGVSVLESTVGQPELATTSTSATFTVLENDDASGVFGFDSQSIAMTGKTPTSLYATVCRLPFVCITHAHTLLPSIWLIVIWV